MLLQPAKFCLVRLRVNLCRGSVASEASADSLLVVLLASVPFLVAARDVVDFDVAVIVVAFLRGDDDAASSSLTPAEPVTSSSSVGCTPF